MIEPVFPIFHKNRNETFIDGTASIVRQGEKNFLVTCAHNFEFTNGTLHYFEFDGKRHVIDPNSKDVCVGNIENVSILRRENAKPSYAYCFEPDFLIMNLSFDSKVMNPLRRGKTSETGLNDSLKLMAYNGDSGKVDVFPCFRPDLFNSVTIPESETRTMLERTNYIRLQVRGQTFPKKGASGGPILNEDGDFIGFLTRGGKEYIYIFKSEEIPFPA